MCLHRPKTGQISMMKTYLSLIQPKGNTMKKVVLALLVAGSMIGGTTAGFAATTAKPTIKPVTKSKTTAKEGTAQHEMSETSETQKNEAKPTAKAKKK
jgi:hypothetical protein